MNGHGWQSQTIHLSAFRNRHDVVPETVTRTWREQLAHIEKPIVRPDKDGALFSPAVFNPSYRKKENVQAVSELVLDYDHGAEMRTDLEVWRSLGLAFAAYTTHSSYRHTESNPEAEERFRVIIPLVEPIPASLFPALWAWTSEQSGGKVDPAAKDASRMFYAPAIAASDARYRFEVNEGQPLDWRALELEEPEVLRPAPQPINYSGKADAYGRAALEGETGRIITASPGGRNHQLNRSAFSLGQLIAGGGLERGEVERALESAALGAGLEKTETRLTIRSGIEAGLREPRRPEEKPQAKPAARPITTAAQPQAQTGSETEGEADETAKQTSSVVDDDGLVSIDTSIDHLPTLTALCWEAIKQQNRPPILFLHNTKIVRAARHPETGKVWLQEVTPEILRHHLAQWANWHKYAHIIKPPLDVVRDVLATKDKPLPVLRRVVSVPVFGRGGSLQTSPGYCEQSGVLFAPDDDFVALPLPAVITKEDVHAANWLICEEVLVDFPFASTADRDNAVALFILPYARDLIDAPTPCHLIEAPMPSSGKSLMAELLMYPAVGDDLGLITAPTKEEEWAKEITTRLLNGKPVVMIDNLGHTLNSASLAAAWTGRVWDNRILGGHDTPNLPIRCVWIMTGNNVGVSSEIATRLVRIRIAPPTDRPEERTEFKHPEPRTYVAAHRAELVRAAHILIQWWIQQDRPAPKVKPHSRYPSWSRVIGGILEAAGYSQFLANYRELQSRTDLDRLARSAFCATWFDWSQGSSRDDEQREKERRERARVTAGDLLPIAEGVEHFSLNGNTPKALQTSLGKWLAQNLDVLVEQQETDEHGNSTRRVFRIERWPTLVGGKQYWMIVQVA